MHLLGVSLRFISCVVQCSFGSYIIYEGTHFMRCASVPVGNAFYAFRVIVFGKTWFVATGEKSYILGFGTHKMRSLH